MFELVDSAPQNAVIKVIGVGGGGASQTNGGSGGPPWISSGNSGNIGSLGIGGNGAIDMLSNGFKCRLASEINNDGTTNIYIAFAEQPFVTSGGVPATAR